MKKKPIWFLIIGIAVLIIPTVIYLCFLVPQMKEEYLVLMSSGGVIAGGGMYGAEIIPEKVKYSSLYKTSARSFTLLTVITLVQEFIMEIIGLVAVFILSFIIFSLLKEMWKNARRRKENTEFAEEIARNIAKTSE